ILPRSPVELPGLQMEKRNPQARNGFELGRLRLFPAQGVTMANPEELEISALLESLNYCHSRIMMATGNKDRDPFFLTLVHRAERSTTACRVIAERNEIVFRLTLRRIPTANNNANNDDPP